LSTLININGRLISAAQANPAPDNRAFRYGDGFFETIRVSEGRVLLSQHHFRRFFAAAAQLKFDIPALLNAERLEKEILQLVEKCGLANHARVRLAAWSGNGGLFEGPYTLHYQIECWPLTKEQTEWNENGLILGFFTEGRKAPDGLANIKSSSFQLYSFAARFAKAQKWNDAIVLNTRDQICDCCIANIFWIHNRNIFTTPLHDGPVAGVFREHLMQHIQVMEKSATVDDLLNADEIFVTNAIRGIRWVQRLDEKQYGSNQTLEIYRKIRQTF
jgi:branched-chain amino acid aminotransferase